ncbi:hypothetical protein HYX00_04330 [Candidatus Woesearchaeota archaeon]|nr:hypothetical protein [Candidatus Woesearchaeota archaeon]
MNVKIAILAVLVFSAFLIGCKPSSQSGYATYNQPQGQPQQQQYVGGGCGVAPSGDYEDTPVEALDLTNSAL